jgi:hypothetical protein
MLAVTFSVVRLGHPMWSCTEPRIIGLRQRGGLKKGSSGTVKIDKLVAVDTSKDEEA